MPTRAAVLCMTRERRVRDQRLVHVLLLCDACVLQLEHLRAIAVLALVYRLGLRDELLRTLLILLCLRHRRGRRVHTWSRTP